MKHRWLTFVLLVPALLTGQENRQAASLYLNQLDFSRYPLVDLYVTVTDAARNPILFNAADTTAFFMEQNNYPVRPSDLQSVLVLKQRGESEMFIAMVFDNSVSMSGRTDLLEAAGRQFVDSLKTGDNVSIIDFGDGNQTVKVPEVAFPLFARQRLTFSNAKQYLRANMSLNVLTDRTFMYDALLYALSSLNATTVLGRKAVILFSDGRENGSASNLETIQTYVRLYDIPIYAIDLNEQINTVLQELAVSSGGEYFHVREARDLTSLYQTVLKLLRGQYRVTYGSPETAINTNEYTVKVELRGRVVGRSARTFRVDGENIAYYNLAYLESVGKESPANYLEFLAGFPLSKRADEVRLKLGTFWKKHGELAKSMATYNVILRNPLSASYGSALLEQAELFSMAKQYTSARKAYAQVISTEGNASVRAKAMLELAKAYTAEGNFALALNTYSSLSSQYAGSETASEAFLQAASLSMEMGDLPGAEKNLKQVVDVYGESKSAVYARLELARIAEKTDRPDEAERLYGEVIQTSTDADLRDEASLHLALVQMKIGHAADAVSGLKQLIAGASSLSAADAARLHLVPALMQAGRFGEARQLLEQLPPAVRSQLDQQYGSFAIASNGIGGTALANTAYATGSFADTAQLPIRTIDWPDAVEKFAAIGPVYALEAPLGSGTASIPVRPDWLRSKVVVPGTSGIFRFANGEWEPITTTLDRDDDAYVFTYSRPGVYALLARPPRIIRLYNIYFDLGQAKIRKDVERLLYEIIDDMKAVPDAKLEIGGHTDTTGTEERNIELSSQRAGVIKEFMIQNGIDADRLIARGYGSQYPIAPNDSPENRQKNRRTEFTLIRPISAPIGTSTGERSRYTVVIRAYRTAKDAYEDKKLFQNRGFDVMVMTNEERPSERYELSLGMFDSEEDARAAIAKFNAEFKGIQPDIIVSRRSR